MLRRYYALFVNGFGGSEIVMYATENLDRAWEKMEGFEYKIPKPFNDANTFFCYAVSTDASLTTQPLMMMVIRSNHTQNWH